MFDAAEADGAVLLFDDVDALFGKRSEVKDSHDRYANIEIQLSAPADGVLPRPDDSHHEHEDSARRSVPALSAVLRAVPISGRRIPHRDIARIYPKEIGRRPVSSAARLGVHTDSAT